MTQSDMLIAKIARGFDHLDADGDGRLDENDHVLMGRRLAAVLGHPDGSDSERRLVDMYLRIWRDLHLPHLPAGRSDITRDEFVTANARAFADDPSAARAALGAAAETFVQIADLDSDGQISPGEFRAFMSGHCPGLSEADADAAFHHMDLDGDGHLSAEEFVSATIDYWTSTDPDAPGNWWLGPPAQ